MNWYRGSTIIEQQQQPATTAAVKSEGPGKKLRRKLQKIGTQQRWYKPNDHTDAKKAEPTPVVTDKNTNSKKTISQTTDTNDGKWLEQLRKSGYLCRGPPPVVRSNEKPHRHSMQVIPEFAHLSVSDTKPGRSLDKRASCATPSSTSSITRQYAKTPVYHIGQLENHPRRDQPAAHKVSSVEAIAESYRALLESSCAILNDSAQEPLPLRLGSSYRPDARHSMVGEDVLREIPEALSVTDSPHSDDGTLVAFEEEAIPFTPRSFSLEPPLRHRREPIRQPPRRASPASPSLQICLDLLGKELSSAANGMSTQSSQETSALQVWVMIEAYERLRDKIHDMQLGYDQEQSLNAMLDTWIQALYTVHDKMMGGDGNESESDYGD
ncbi:uncharacterized protein GGS25DRAFT_485719 [Hypoxylon fragiforme]|uniref:uncharacterized protein n=1 Tax=Hypoxylon fragiforme TaxID=63214 RepID=UPI0020C62894|nr:uncharacterized protein GGS25DRAFT_485719 [Hypoxylon fragiforme]KAI2609677.1 hypothetical protein GGS25DRAFT_485719 [Hypoxylon fragiforme]